MFRKLLLFLSINFIIAIVAGLMPVSVLNKDAFERQQVVYSYIDSVQSGSSISVILGDSRPECCIAAEKLGFVNLSLAGTSPVEGYYLLNLLLEREVNIDQLIISYGPNHLFGQEIFYSRTRYFGLVDKEFLEEVSKAAHEQNDQQYLSYNWRALEVIDDYLPFLPEQLKLALVNVLTLNETIKSGLKYTRDLLSPAAGEVRLVADPRYKLFEATPEDIINEGRESPEYFEQSSHSIINEQYLNKILQVSRTNEIEVAYVFMPFNRDVLQPESEYFQEVDKLINESGLKDCVIDIQWYPNDEFFDPAHLNPVGVAHFSDYLGDNLNFCSSLNY